MHRAVAPSVGGTLASVVGDASEDVAPSDGGEVSVGGEASEEVDTSDEGEASEEVDTSETASAGAGVADPSQADTKAPRVTTTSEARTEHVMVATPFTARAA